VKPRGGSAGRDRTKDRRPSRNALKHGLSSKMMCRNRRTAAIVRLLEQAYPSAARDLIEQAADCQNTILEVRRVKAAIPADSSGIVFDWLRLERYERRAFSRRRALLRQLDLSLGLAPLAALRQ
jgi:hypothetical protein